MYGLMQRRNSSPSTVWNDFDNLFEKGLKKWPGFLFNEVAPPVKIVENEDGYEISAEMPGIDKKSVDISYEQGMLTLKAKKKEKERKEKEKIIVDEQFCSSYSRSLSLPDVDVDKAEAELKDGILLIKLPKSEANKTRRISIS